MSIVSMGLGVNVIGTKYRHGPRNPVQFKKGSPDSTGSTDDELFTQAPQLPCLSKKKPALPSNVKQSPIGVVPLRCEQAGYVAPAFGVPVPTMLTGKRPVPTDLTVGHATMDVSPQPANYDYLQPIRAGTRKLNPFEVSEPAGMLFRP